MAGIFHHKDAGKELKCPKSILLQRSKMVILRVAIIKGQADVCGIFTHEHGPRSICRAGELNLTGRDGEN